MVWFCAFIRQRIILSHGTSLSDLEVFIFEGYKRAPVYLHISLGLVLKPPADAASLSVGHTLVLEKQI